MLGLASDLLRHAGGVVDFAREFYGAGARLSHTLTAFGGEATLSAGIDYDRSRDDRREEQLDRCVWPNLQVQIASMIDGNGSTGRIDRFDR